MLIGIGAGVLILFYIFIVSANSLAAKMIPLEWEKKIGAIAYENILQNNQKITSENVTSALSKILERIDAHDGSNMKYELAIIDVKQVNAFALPGGYLIITSELLKQAKEAEEVAGVLSHEITHVLEQHGLKKIIRQAGMGILIAIILGDASIIAQLADLASNLKILHFDRIQEEKADAGAVKILKQADISPSHFISFLDILKSLEKSNLNDIPELLSTHPMTEKRIERLSKIKEPDNIRSLGINWSSVKSILEN